MARTTTNKLYNNVWIYDCRNLQFLSDVRCMSDSVNIERSSDKMWWLSSNIC